MADACEQYDVFLSHNSIDKPWVAKLKTALESLGLKVWLDKDEIRPGDLFAEALENGILNSKALVMVVSPESVASNWVKEEYYRALSLAHSTGKPLRLIPLLLRNAEMPGFLSSRHWVDFRDEAGFERSVEELVWGITGIKAATSHQVADSQKESGPLYAEILPGEVANPYISAISAALKAFPSLHESQRFTVRPIASPAELEDLWALDSAAYGQASITYEQFRGWWDAFPLGLKALFFGPTVMGALGIWPVSQKWADSLRNGKAREAEIQPRMLQAFRKTAAQSWYISGIVLRPELRKTRAIKILLTDGLREWLEDDRVAYPIELLALAYSAAGQALLERFGFLRLQNAAHMADGFPLYGIRAPSKVELLKVFNARGLALG